MPRSTGIKISIESYYDLGYDRNNALSLMLMGQEQGKAPEAFAKKTILARRTYFRESDVGVITISRTVQLKP